MSGLRKSDAPQEPTQKPEPSMSLATRLAGEVGRGRDLDGAPCGQWVGMEGILLLFPFPIRGACSRAEQRNLLGLKRHMLAYQPWGSQGGHTQDAAPHAGGAAPAWSPDLDANRLGSSFSACQPLPHTRTYLQGLLGPPGEGVPQGRLGIELRLESPAFHLLPAEPTAQVRWSPAPDPPPIQGTISMPKGRHQLR